MLSQYNTFVPVAETRPTCSNHMYTTATLTQLSKPTRHPDCHITRGMDNNVVSRLVYTASVGGHFTVCLFVYSLRMSFSLCSAGFASAQASCETEERTQRV